jgi:hypothetical protein
MSTVPRNELPQPMSRPCCTDLPVLSAIRWYRLVFTATRCDMITG